MTQSSNLMATLVRKSTLGALLAATAIMGGMHAAYAVDGQVGAANFKAADCDPPPPNVPPPHIIPLPPGHGHPHSGSQSAAATPNAVQGTATTTFVQIAAFQEGFGGTQTAAKLTQDAGGTAGLILRKFTYVGDPTTDQNNLRGINIHVKGKAKAFKNTSVNFCLQDNNGTGNIITYSTTLNTLPQSDLGDGFTNVFLGADTIGGGNFGGIPAGNTVLRKMTFTLTNQNSHNTITIGETMISTVIGSFDPVGINLNQGNCNALFNCPGPSGTD